MFDSDAFSLESFSSDSWLFEEYPIFVNIGGHFGKKKAVKRKSLAADVKKVINDAPLPVAVRRQIANQSASIVSEYTNRIEALNSAIDHANKMIANYLAEIDDEETIIMFL